MFHILGTCVRDAASARWRKERSGHGADTRGRGARPQSGTRSASTSSAPFQRRPSRALSTLRGFVQYGMTTVVAGLEGSADSSWAPFLDALRADVDAYPDRMGASRAAHRLCGRRELASCTPPRVICHAGRLGTTGTRPHVCMEGEACLTIYHREEIVATIPVTAGGRVTFPGRLFHRVDGGTRLVFTCLLVGAPRAH